MREDSDVLWTYNCFYVDAGTMDYVETDEPDFKTVDSLIQMMIEEGDNQK